MPVTAVRFHLLRLYSVEGPVTSARSAARRMWIAVRTYNLSPVRALVTDLISPDRTPRSRVRVGVPTVRLGVKERIEAKSKRHIPRLR